MMKEPLPGRAGAMTAAMRAVQNSHARKVLRLGVSEHGRMVDERVVLGREAVSFGTSERCTFTLGDRALSAHAVWFEPAGDHFRLRFTARMHGRIARDSTRTLDELVTAGEARREGDAYVVDLDERTRGRVSLGAVTVFFQFVAAPPVQPRAQLPSAIRTRPMRDTDWTWSACLAVCCGLVFGGLATFEYAYDPDVSDRFDVAEPVRYVRFDLPPMMFEAPHETQEIATHEAVAETPAHRDPPRVTAHPHAPTAPSAEHVAASAEHVAVMAQRAAEVALAAGNTAEFRELVAAAGGNRNAVDTLAGGQLMIGSVEALRNVGGVSTASTTVGLHRTGLVASNAPGGNDLGRSHRVADTAVGTDPASTIERRTVPNIALDPGDIDVVDPGLSQDAITRGLRSASSRMRSCYERAMRNSPELRGRIEIGFTIGTSGRITHVTTRGLDDAAELNTCVQDAMRRIVFPAPSIGTVDGTTAVAFAPGG